MKNNHFKDNIRQDEKGFFVQFRAYFSSPPFDNTGRMYAPHRMSLMSALRTAIRDCPYDLLTLLLFNFLYNKYEIVLWPPDFNGDYTNIDRSDLTKGD